MLIDIEQTFDKIQFPRLVKKEIDSPQTRHRKELPEFDKVDFTKYLQVLLYLIVEEWMLSPKFLLNIALEFRAIEIINQFSKF